MIDATVVIKSIVEHQRTVIGPLAVEQANKVQGLHVDVAGDITVKVSGGNIEIMLTDLVKRYEELFGRASIEVCRDAVREIKPHVDLQDLPKILQ